ncbi:MAG: imelysin family protein, partial [Ostreibacterium sp.]
DISTQYTANRQTFISDEDKSISFVLNALIDSAYKAKEWRAGEAPGLAKKYQGKPDNKRQEYPFSQQSLTAIEGVLETHDDIMGQRPYTNLASVAIKAGANQEVAYIRGLIKTAKQQLATLQSASASKDFANAKMKGFYKTLGRLNDAYYKALVKALPVQANILDADGD